MGAPAPGRFPAGAIPRQVRGCLEDVAFDVVEVEKVWPAKKAQEQILCQFLRHCGGASSAPEEAK